MEGGLFFLLSTCGSSRESGDWSNKPLAALSAIDDGDYRTSRDLFLLLSNAINAACSKRTPILYRRPLSIYLLLISCFLKRARKARNLRKGKGEILNKQQTVNRSKSI